jgi:hypothetical protein
VVHAPFSGERTFYCILKRARQKGLPIPDTIRDDGNDNGLITLTAFRNRYRNETEKRTIWESIFNFDRLQKHLGDNNARVTLGYAQEWNGSERGNYNLVLQAIYKNHMIDSQAEKYVAMKM